MNASGTEIRIAPLRCLYQIRDAIIDIGEILGARREGAPSGEHPAKITTIDEVWFQLPRDRAALLYNAMKRHPSVHQLAQSLAPTNHAVVDVNFRVDAPGETQFLFGWHQDYWFSVCSPAALVAWVPLNEYDPALGGLEVIPGSGRIYAAKPGGEEWRSYADAAVIDELVDEAKATKPVVNFGEVLWFRFDLLHRSVLNKKPGRCRWTAQIRYASYLDKEFEAAGFRPASVRPENVPYLDELAASIKSKGV